MTRDEVGGLRASEREALLAWWDSEWPRDGSDTLDVLAEVVAGIVAGRVGEAEGAVARVGAVLADPKHRWWHTGGTQCSPLYAIRDALDGPGLVPEDARKAPESDSDASRSVVGRSEGSQALHPCSRCGGRQVVNPHPNADLVVCEECAHVLAVDGFVSWVASNAAHNGAPDEGQRFYDECLNAWLPKQADRFLGRETT